MLQAKAEIPPTVGIGIGRMAQTPRFDTQIGVGWGGFLHGFVCGSHKICYAYSLRVSALRLAS